MTQQSDAFPDVVTATSDWLHSTYGAGLTPLEIEGLTAAIVVYVRRSRYPARDIIPRIVENYIKDGTRVHELLADSDANAWKAIMQQIITFATAHPYYPTIEDATSSPDLDAYEDIQRNLASYNFECPLDRWINTVVIRRLLRFWRDRQSLRAGGVGFLAKEVRDAQRRGDEVDSGRRISHISLDGMVDDAPVSEQIEAPQPAIYDIVEGTVLEKLVEQLVGSYAMHVDEPDLPKLWRSIVLDELKLREVAEMYNMTINQIHYRVQQINRYLSKHPDILGWRDADPDHTTGLAVGRS